MSFTTPVSSAQSPQAVTPVTPVIPPSRQLEGREVVDLIKGDGPLGAQVERIKSFLEFVGSPYDPSAYVKAVEKFYLVREKGQSRCVRLRTLNYSSAQQVFPDADMYARHYNFSDGNVPGSGDKLRKAPQANPPKDPHIQFAPNNMNIIVFELGDNVYVHNQNIDPDAKPKTFFTVFTKGSDQTRVVDVEAAGKELECEKAKIAENLAKEKEIAKEAEASRLKNEEATRMKEEIDQKEKAAQREKEEERLKQLEKQLTAEMITNGKIGEKTRAEIALKKQELLSHSIKVLSIPPTSEGLAMALAHREDNLAASIGDDE